MTLLDIVMHDDMFCFHNKMRNACYNFLYERSQVATQPKKTWNLFIKKTFCFFFCFIKLCFKTKKNIVLKHCFKTADVFFKPYGHLYKKSF